MNNLTVSGRLGRDPELRSTASGDPVCSFSLAVNRRKRDADALWFDVSVWGKQGETVARFLSKGSEAVICGEVDVREFDRRDGTPGFALTLNARQVTFVGGKSDGGDGERSAPAQSQAPPPASDRTGYTPDDDDIPF